MEICIDEEEEDHFNIYFDDRIREKVVRFIKENYGNIILSDFHIYPKGDFDQERAVLDWPRRAIGTDCLINLIAELEFAQAIRIDQTNDPTTPRT